MRFLLDTVALYRAVTTPEALPNVVRAVLSDGSNHLFVSVVSAWELAIKASLGKLSLPGKIEDLFPQAIRDLLAETVNVELRYIAKVADLPQHHGDPFDRMIIAQALVEGYTVLTSDAHFAAYGVGVLW